MRRTCPTCGGSGRGESVLVAMMMERVGAWIPDEYQPERMTKSQWEEERLVSLWTIEDEGGFSGEWGDRACPVYVVRLPVDQHEEG